MSLARFLREERGATAIEYALLAALIAMAIFAAIIPIGTQLSSTFGSAADGLQN